jgi:hypothetical protein
MNGMTPYYKGQFDDALIFQDWLMRYLNRHGIILQVFSSREYQYKIGETTSHDEIKFDKRQENTGNLAIETHEKTHPDNLMYVESGILRSDIVRWVQGNYTNIWIFSAKDLKKYIFDGLQRQNNPLPTYKIPTSMGILLPSIEADKLCMVKFRPMEKNLIREVEITRPEVPPYYEATPRKEKSLFEF